MPTCCVCQGYYPDPDSGVPDCTRCGADNTGWEKAHHEKFRDFIGKVHWYLLIPLAVILLELFFAPAFMFSDGQFRPIAFVLALALSAFSLALIGVCYAIRFRLREEALLKSVIVAKRRTLVELLWFAPAIVSLAALVILLLIALAASVFRSGNVFESLWYDIIMPGPEMKVVYLYVFLASWIFPTAIFVTRRYVGSLDLPLPIFLNLPLMREMTLREYLGKPRGSSLPMDAEWRGIKRTAQGGLVVILRRKVDDKIIQVELESDRWARLLRAEEKKEDKSY